jgi:nucleoside-diphosphate-sugar epimerase
MRVLVTGATGFIGGALARALAAEGAEIHALIRPGANPGALDGLAVSWHEGDVTLPASLGAAMTGAEWIIHAAGRLGQAGVPEHVYQRVHVEGTRNVLEAALALPDQPRVLYVSTLGVLGPVSGTPAPEHAPYGPTNPYERSKAAAERVAIDFAARGLRVVICRPGFVYGPRDRHVLGLFRAINRGRFFLIDGGRHLCMPTYIDDAVDGMLLSMRSAPSGAIYNLTGPRAVSFREFGETIAAALGVRRPWMNLPRWCALLAATGLELLGRMGGWAPPLSRTGVAFFSEDALFSSKKATDELGYTPKYDLAEGVARTIAWYRQRGWL